MATFGGRLAYSTETIHGESMWHCESQDSAIVFVVFGCLWRVSTTTNCLSHLQNFRLCPVVFFFFSRPPTQVVMSESPIRRTRQGLFFALRMEGVLRDGWCLGATTRCGLTTQYQLCEYISYDTIAASFKGLDGLANALSFFFSEMGDARPYQRWVCDQPLGVYIWVYDIYVHFLTRCHGILGNQESMRDFKKTPDDCNLKFQIIHIFSQGFETLDLQLLSSYPLD